LVGNAVTLPVAGVDTMGPEEAPKFYLPAAISNLKAIDSPSLEVILVLVEKVVVNDVNFS
jgi:hypothetical protein